MDAQKEQGNGKGSFAGLVLECPGAVVELRHGLRVAGPDALGRPALVALWRGLDEPEARAAHEQAVGAALDKEVDGLLGLLLLNARVVRAAQVERAKAQGLSNGVKVPARQREAEHDEPFGRDLERALDAVALRVGGKERQLHVVLELEERLGGHDVDLQFEAAQLDAEHDGDHERRGEHDGHQPQQAAQLGAPVVAGRQRRDELLDRLGRHSVLWFFVFLCC